MARVEITIAPETSAGALAATWAPLEFAGECLAILVRVLKILGYVLIFLVVVVLPVAALAALPLGIFLKRRRRSRLTA